MGGGVRGSLGRLAPALILTALMVGLFLRSTLPALQERDALRQEREQAEAEVESLRADLRRDEAWIQAAERGDAYVLERERDAMRRTPDHDGPTYEVVAPPREEPEDARVDGELQHDGVGEFEAQR